MSSDVTKQARRERRIFEALTRRAIRALDGTARSLRRRGREVLDETRGREGPDPEADRKIEGRIASAIERLDEYLDGVATRRTLARMRAPRTKEKKSQRRARQFEAVAGCALEILSRVQERLEEGEWRRALSKAREGARELEHKLGALDPLPEEVDIQELPPIAEPPEEPGDENEGEAA